MCGIAGWLGSVPDGPALAGRIAEGLRHRGPDASGVQSWPEATLIHTRLRVIDLSAAGAQPMANEDGTVWTVFNGEIYNHRELRHRLEARGHVFRGRSDTEVLPHLYEEEGVAFIPELRGMFALAIYDARRRRLFLARDRFGIKPLFYSAHADRLAFASEIASLLQLPDLDSRPDRQAIHDLASLLYIPAPDTFYVGIRALKPAELLEARLESGIVTWKTSAFHRWTVAPDPALSLEKAADRADELVETAVRRQLQSDVPLGTLLSGGIDSSLVSVAAQNALRGDLKTYNVRFPDKAFDETWSALKVAEEIKSQHKTLNMNGSTGTWEHITGLLRHAGQPFGDTSLFAVNAVCRLMRDQVTVALSGDGGDEGFGGYGLYWRVARFAQLQSLPPSLWKLGSATLSPLARLGIIPERFQSRVRDLQDTDDTLVIQRIFEELGEDHRQKLCYMSPDLLPIRRHFEAAWNYELPDNADRLERLSARTTESTIALQLPNDFLFKVDTASMKESMEIRVPLLDEDLFAFALTVPHRLKVRGRTCKLILREVARRKLPREIADKSKMGFGVPVDIWTGGPFKQRLRETLLDSSSKLRDVFRPEFYRPALEAFCGGQPFPGMSRSSLYRLAITLLSVHIALERPSRVSVHPSRT